MFNKRIILASASPRRREIMKQFGFNFESIPSDADESGVDNLAPHKAVMELARRKAVWIKERYPEKEEIILAADTLVALDGELLGKPKDEEDAFRMLSALSGTNHQVYTGYAILQGDKTVVDYDCTQVFFRPLEKEEIEAYIATGEPMDKAGAYGIQEKAGIFVRRVEGDYLNVLGLPICKIYEQLKRM
ncbi:MAG: septum formation inhibitor Maf [Clostridia bacterium]|nr:septum formation inhibitor Maf [Clostridia bacterium]